MIELPLSWIATMDPGKEDAKAISPGCSAIQLNGNSIMCQKVAEGAMLHNEVGGEFNYHLGMLFYNGEGVKKNLAKAHTYIMQAATLGRYKKARETLVELFGEEEDTLNRIDIMVEKMGGYE